MKVIDVDIDGVKKEEQDLDEVGQTIDVQRVIDEYVKREIDDVKQAARESREFTLYFNGVRHNFKKTLLGKEYFYHLNDYSYHFLFNDGGIRFFVTSMNGLEYDLYTLPDVVTSITLEPLSYVKIMFDKRWHTSVGTTIKYLGATERAVFHTLYSFCYNTFTDSDIVYKFVNEIVNNNNYDQHYKNRDSFISSFALNKNSFAVLVSSKLYSASYHLQFIKHEFEPLWDIEVKAYERKGY